MRYSTIGKIDFKDPQIRPLVQEDSKTLQWLFREIPLWVKNPDFDRVDWINKIIKNMWPYLDTAICNAAKTIEKPIIVEQIPKYKIQSVDFETFTLGGVIIECDSKNAITWIDNPDSPPWYLRQLILKIKALRGKTLGWQITYIPRSGNDKADNLAKSGVDRSNDLLCIYP
ncbi:Calcium-dependent lipid-binding (CaLB domain) family protein, putative [Theobroma cacao]|uniref:Calcium-dependent lipid-binding (CaLB domain) family protein, putative n=1 Tax=Theobroma cacao TaxID=3641 RepID=A0A061FDS5_THECC|nr:Calcium-dependent lipid-binding (CaLB domain) family protein, putative [Theobroma cacao]